MADAKPDLLKDIGTLNKTFPLGVFGESDGEDMNGSEPVKIIVLYLPTSEYSVQHVKRHMGDWMQELPSKHTELEQLPSVTLFRLVRASIPWSPVAAASQRVAIREAAGLLDDLSKEATSGETRRRIRRLRELLIPT